MTMGKTLVLSPHFDDAILSCGSFLLKNSHFHSILLVNIFTNFKSGTPNTVLSNQLEKLKQNKYQFQKLRESEDFQAWQGLKIKKVSLGFLDAGFRSYHTHTSIFEGTVKGDDLVLEHKLYCLLEQIKSKHSFDTILVPYGLGNHIDHTIARRVAEKLWKQKNIIYYLDQPYYSQGINFNNIQRINLLFQKKYHIKQSAEKIKRLLCYSSQIKFLFKQSHQIFFNEVLLLNKD